MTACSVAVVIPAFCEERLIGPTLRGIPASVSHIFVVDDASPDSTSARAREVGDPRVQVIRHEHNRGVGAAIYTGYQAALQTDAEILVVMAGDNQMDPLDLPRLLTPILEQKADYVKGNRLLHESRSSMPLHRQWGTRLLALATSIAADCRLHDSQCGYTALRRRAALALSFRDMWQSYGYPNDILIALARRGFRIAEVPVRAVYADEKSGLRPWHLLSILRVIAKRSWRERREPWPQLGTAEPELTPAVSPDRPARRGIAN